ncbi:hypothetical protein GCM10011583_73650 [Streptomyces camponoticapitis]|uniref:Uncharacterized protein n=1 Tax=Streptomyces camponoticapitis TaxID=1616125 RepID=A0ABQ2EXT1_9ACTN|nr:hypothetical protein [Streptomyces camponoticapitis]GGK31030.1 hypothetical protein GCM10011583_73650 [Streptomyces camponoticapitis]
MCEQILGITPATEDEKPKRPRTQADKWTANLAAARQFFEREGHLQSPASMSRPCCPRTAGRTSSVWGHGSAASAPGRNAIPGTGGAAVPGRDAVVVMGVVVTVAAALAGLVLDWAT